MEEFPKLSGHQVALMRADTFTGHILDDKLQVARKQNQTIYSIFNSVEDALQCANSIILLNKAIECVIYGDNKDVLYYLKDKSFLSR